MFKFNLEALHNIFVGDEWVCVCVCGEEKIKGGGGGGVATERVSLPAIWNVSGVGHLTVGLVM